MKESHGFSYIADAVAVVMTGIQTNELFQTISLVLTIVATGFSIIFTGVRLYYWFKNASEDGKISKEEVDEAKSIIEDVKKDHLDNK